MPRDELRDTLPEIERETTNLAIDISILIVSYNTRTLTLECVRSVYAQTTGVAFEVIVWDNASDDGSADAIAEMFPSVKLIRSSENVGFAQANNLAAREAVGEFLLLLNPDTVVLDRAIERLLAFAVSSPQIGVFGGRTFFADGSLNPASCWRRPTLWSTVCIAVGLTAVFSGLDVFARESFGSWPRDTVREVDIVSGCFFLIRRELWEKLGGFDPAFFMYGEEADLCLRAAKLGVRCAVTPDARIVHYGGASEKVRADKMVKLFKAKAMLAERHWPARQRWMAVAALDLWALTRVVAFGILGPLKPKWREAYQMWAQIWRRRGEWRVGEPQAPRDLSEGPAKHGR